MERRGFFERLKSFFISASIIKTIKTSHIVIIVLLLVPLMLLLVTALLNTISYNRLIANVERTNDLNQVVKTAVTNELWDIVAGNKSFRSGNQYQIINRITGQLKEIMDNTGDYESRSLLEGAARTMNTLTKYVDRLGLQMEEKAPVTENINVLDNEIRVVSAQVSEQLQDFIVREIESAAAANRRITARAIIIGVVELGVITFAILFSIFVQMSVSKSVDRSIRSLVELSGSIAEGNLDARAEVSRVQELEDLTEDLNTMAVKIKTLIDENIQEQRNLQKSEMKALQAQITPHFLYNTMDSIVWLAEGHRNEEVISITRAFSDFFRISLNRGNEWVRVQDEFKHIENYLTIQKIRYRDILDYSVEYEQEMERKMMLKLLLQPLVENALYHGIKNKRSRGVITVRGWHDGDFLRFSVEDDGIGMTEEQLASVKEQLTSAPAYSAERTMANPGDYPDGAGQKSGAARIYGLYNVAKRLELYYNRVGLLDITSVYREGSRVTLLIPDRMPGEVSPAEMAENAHV